MDQNDLRRKALTGQQKTGFVLLLIFGILAVGLGLLQIRNRVYGPFAYKPLLDSQLSPSVTDPVLRLKYIDTDHDGLTDYDEIYVYHTSPYLWSTASDNMSDKEKIAKNLNPLCAANNQNCTAGAQYPGSEGVLSSTASPSSTIIDMGSPLANVATAQDIINQTVATNDNGAFSGFKQDLQDPKTVREMLLATGKIATDTLSKIDDQSLMQMITQLLQESSTSTTAGSNNNLDLSDEGAAKVLGIVSTTKK